MNIDTYNDRPIFGAEDEDGNGVFLAFFYLDSSRRRLGDGLGDIKGME